MPEDPLLRVLCVDDNQDAADSLRVMLELVGFDARSCYDSTEALALADAYHPDACILDLTMPGMDGDELGRRIRQKDWAKTLPLVAMTALGDEDSRRRTALAGFDLHLTKPFDPDQLANVIADIIILRSFSHASHETEGGRLGGQRATDPPIATDTAVSSN